ncbi:IniB N-terminal domain-containing protein [Amycolatopsis suaedae]|uniref:Uncharacterized protein n=1 Tax=Amycolatopsis suaedae TaxID=2510978 RepID=A0A4Q7JAX6_9PSEU|nr:IniB N-terminal domain-containing protein [Amycolatopsis suaedae]RZQ64427.1 hypothetical protein EWH70_10745 [Amycolatopsis suaedae]
MSFPDLTLHNFVLNLLTDDAARSDFLANPAGTLDAAGLGEVSGQDVQEVLPLALDSLPGADKLPVGDLPLGGAETAVAQLQALAHQVAGPLAPVLGDFTSASEFGDVGFANSFAANGGPLTDLNSAIASQGTDIAASTGLNNAVGDLGLATAGGAGGLAGSLSLVNDHVAGQGAFAASTEGAALSGGVGSELGGLGLAGAGSAGGVAGSAEFDSALANGGGALDAGLHGVAANAQADSALGGFAFAADGGLNGFEGDLSIGNDTAGVNLGVEAGTSGGSVDLEFHPELGVPEVSLPLPALPALPEVPGVPAAPEAPTAPDLSSLPQLPTPELPVDLPELPSELPVKLPVDVPTELPTGDLPGAGDVLDKVGESPVGDVVDKLPVGDVAGKLPVVGDLTDGLGL